MPHKTYILFIALFMHSAIEANTFTKHINKKNFTYLTLATTISAYLFASHKKKEINSNINTLETISFLIAKENPTTPATNIQTRIMKIKETGKAYCMFNINCYRTITNSIETIQKDIQDIIVKDSEINDADRAKNDIFNMPYQLRNKTSFLVELKNKLISDDNYKESNNITKSMIPFVHDLLKKKTECERENITAITTKKDLPMPTIKLIETIIQRYFKHFYYYTLSHHHSDLTTHLKLADNTKNNQLDNIVYYIQKRLLQAKETIEKDSRWPLISKNRLKALEADKTFITNEYNLWKKMLSN